MAWAFVSGPRQRAVGNGVLHDFLDELRRNEHLAVRDRIAIICSRIAVGRERDMAIDRKLSRTAAVAAATGALLRLATAIPGVVRGEEIRQRVYLSIDLMIMLSLVALFASQDRLRRGLGPCGFGIAVAGVVLLRTGTRIGAFATYQVSAAVTDKGRGDGLRLRCEDEPYHFGFKRARGRPAGHVPTADDPIVFYQPEEGTGWLKQKQSANAQSLRQIRNRSFGTHTRRLQPHRIAGC